MKEISILVIVVLLPFLFLVLASYKQSSNMTQFLRLFGTYFLLFSIMLIFTGIFLGIIFYPSPYTSGNLEFSFFKFFSAMGIAGLLFLSIAFEIIIISSIFKNKIKSFRER